MKSLFIFLLGISLGLNIFFLLPKYFGEESEKNKVTKNSKYSETYILSPDDKTKTNRIIHRNGPHFESEDGLYKFKIISESQEGITLIYTPELGPGFDFYIIHKNDLRYTHGTFSSYFVGGYLIHLGDVKIEENEN